MITKAQLVTTLLIGSSILSVDTSFAENKKDFPPAYFSDSFTNAGNTCTIHLKKTYTTSWIDSSEKLEYSVYCNNKFMHPNSRDGGTIIGCRQIKKIRKLFNSIVVSLLNFNWVKKICLIN